MVATANEDFRFTLPLYRFDGTALELTNIESIQSHCRDRLNNLLFEFTATVLDAEKGIIQLSIDGNDTTNLHGIYLFDIAIEFPDGISYSKTVSIYIKKAKTLLV